jgi:hypothetical protein
LATLQALVGETLITTHISNPRAHVFLKIYLSLMQAEVRYPGTIPINKTTGQFEAMRK